MVFCHVKNVPYFDLSKTDIFNDSFSMKDAERKDMVSLNGARVTENINSIVSKNKTAFLLALQTIKSWAQTRGVYSGVMGFLGGVSWAILVAKICQLYPNGNAAVIIKRF
eukprot:UN34562